jgi:hypothetical protein
LPSAPVFFLGGGYLKMIGITPLKKLVEFTVKPSSLGLSMMGDFIIHLLSLLVIGLFIFSVSS